MTRRAAISAALLVELPGIETVSFEHIIPADLRKHREGLREIT
jgi:hypothetical protein